jgi:hypothetical protein
MKLAALLLVVLVTGGWAVEKHSRSGNERALSSLASELAGRRVHVRCQSLWLSLVDVDSKLGDVPFTNGHAASYTHITRPMCRLLARFRHESRHAEIECLAHFDWSRFHGDDPAALACSQRAEDMAEALMTLAHESMHLRGWADEAAAQCYGLQQLTFTVERLGGTLAEGLAVTSYMLALQQWVPEEYQSADCARGGLLDLYPKTRPFPTEEVPAALPRGLFGPQL